MNLTIYFVSTPMETIDIDKASIPLDSLQDSGVIIWERQGLFRVVSNAVLRNLYSIRCEFNQFKEHYPMTDVSKSPPIIHWDQGVDISKNAAMVLLH